MTTTIEAPADASGRGSYAADGRVQLNLRIRAADLALVRQAARVDDRSVSSFARQAVRQAAHRVLAETPEID